MELLYPLFSIADSTKRIFVFVIIFLLFTVSIQHSEQLFAETSSVVSFRPNIIILMLDDLDLRSLDGLRRHGAIPNLEKEIFSQGIEFRESFVTNPVCCPSRATLLTGQYSHNHHVFANRQLNGGIASFDDSSTLATWPQSNGYMTTHIGKYLNGYGIYSELIDRPLVLSLLREVMQKQDAGISKRYEFSYIPLGWDIWHGLLDLSTFCAYNFMLNVDDKVYRYFKDGSVTINNVVILPPARDNIPQHHQTDVLADHTIEVVRELVSRDEPFFLSKSDEVGPTCRSVWTQRC